MLNIAGPEYDFAQVLYAVLQECEHRRRGLDDETIDHGANGIRRVSPRRSAARFLFALAGLVIGSIIIALPFIPIFEDLFAFALTAAGFLYPDIVHYIVERRHARFLNRLIAGAERYQSTARLHYMTTQQIRESFTPGEKKLELRD